MRETCQPSSHLRPSAPAQRFRQSSGAREIRIRFEALPPSDAPPCSAWSALGKIAPMPSQPQPPKMLGLPILPARYHLVLCLACRMGSRIVHRVKQPSDPAECEEQNANDAGCTCCEVAEGDQPVALAIPHSHPFQQNSSVEQYRARYDEKCSSNLVHRLLYFLPNVWAVSATPSSSDS